jgi:NADPH:quinone reductase-like Zn-dependent oxidoreductase
MRPVCCVCAVEMALERMAAVKRTDRVLVHAAAGGVGLAAIQVAQVHQSRLSAIRHQPKLSVAQIALSR